MPVVLQETYGDYNKVSNVMMYLPTKYIPEYLSNRGWFPMFVSFQDCQLLNMWIVTLDANMYCNTLPHRIFRLNTDTRGCSLLSCEGLHTRVMHKLQIRNNQSIWR